MPNAANMLKGDGPMAALMSLFAAKQRQTQMGVQPPGVGPGSLVDPSKTLKDAKRTAQGALKMNTMFAPADAKARLLQYVLAKRMR